jgi:hypothetical protein
MRDTPVATRDDDNSFIITRCYRRAIKVPDPKLVCGCGS